ncbi:MAG: RnfH family protein [Xanthomonadaceae bacterium]|nr:RnfH family protein [Xanthomonadaceae bacterium]MDE1961212.1 RnfH family protein [Xanthomonadaceae bacterium]MDE2083691.1 RnfH family protein [Xanthomonadaceae bacterium]MDE2256195.1 RnfH family protein [Xanthomonadaceae bacterium]
MPETIRVEVAYADPQRQILRAVDIAAGATVADAIAASGVLNELPGFAPAGFGIFGRRVKAETLLGDGDRVELYRPLQLDPKSARRKRAERRT